VRVGYCSRFGKWEVRCRIHHRESEEVDIRRPSSTDSLFYHTRTVGYYPRKMRSVLFGGRGKSSGELEVEEGSVEPVDRSKLFHAAIIGIGRQGERRRDATMNKHLAKLHHYRYR
jgi:hypothetical protein